MSAHPLVIIVHELFYWKDAQEYISKYKPIINEEEYVRALCRLDYQKVGLLIRIQCEGSCRKREENLR